MPGPGVHHMRAVLSLVLALLVLVSGAWSQSDLVQGCLGVLSQGIYNTVSETSAASRFTEAFQAFCQSETDYSYDQYLADNSSTTDTSNYKGYNAAGSFASFGGGGWSKLGLQFGKTGGKRAMTTTEFAEAKLYIKEHKQAECGFSSFKDLLNAATSSFSVVVDPNIVNAYVQCLKLKHDAGISYTFEYGTDRNDFSATLKYVQPARGPGATATLAGITMSPPSSANCTVSGANIYKEISGNADLQINLPNQATVVITCAVVGTFNNETSDEAKATDIFIATSPGGAYRAVLYRSPRASALTDLNAQVTTLSETNAAQHELVTTQLDEMTTSLSQLTTSLGELKAALNQQTTQVEALKIKLTALGVDDNGYIPLLKADTIEARVLKAADAFAGVLWLHGNGTIDQDVKWFMRDESNNMVVRPVSDGGGLDWKLALFPDQGIRVSNVNQHKCQAPKSSGNFLFCPPRHYLASIYALDSDFTPVYVCCTTDYL